MDEVVIVAGILEEAAKLGFELYTDIRDAISKRRPDLTGDVPPVGEEAALIADANAQIAKKFGAN